MSQLPVGILLAAGASRRFGSNKLLHPMDGDTPMLFVTAKKLLSVLPKCITVINEELMPYAAQLEQLGMSVVVNQQPKRGMGTSIACGVEASQEASGWLITLADMPYVKTTTLQQLVDRLSAGADIVAPLYRQQRGHPVGFQQRYKDELMALHDDIGARPVIARHRNQLELIQCTDAGVIRDVDALSDFSNGPEDP